jgi:hypothetical protein
MKYVYLLSDHEEHGAEHVVATLFRGRLAALIDETWGDVYKSDCKAEKIALVSLLELGDEELSAPMEECGRSERGSMGHLLNDGWGGIQLHVVKLS